jgi:hypothetical protein
MQAQVGVQAADAAAVARTKKITTSAETTAEKLSHWD